MSEKCSEQVSGEGQWGSFHPHRCYRPAKVQVDGKWYCAVHDPAYIKKKREAEQRKWDENWAKRRVETHGPALLALVEKMLPEYRDYAKVVERWAEENAGYQSEVEMLNKTIAEANILIAKCKGEGPWSNRGNT